MEIKKTAVDFYDQQLHILDLRLKSGSITIGEYFTLKAELFSQSKQMEKDQIGLAFIVGYAHGSVDSGLTAKEYYSERYEDKAENND